jgi:dUTP pyrophosphatase|tara:strand:- start:10 stop:639 length:630 start_codon:yes stop_codon:yes gene_type:complete
MKNLNNMGFDPKIYNDILEKFEKIKFDAGIEPDEESQKELEELFGVDLEDFEDLDDEFFKNSQTRTIEVELIHKDAVFPKYAYLSDSGFDLHSTQDLEIKPFGRILVPTGIKVSFEKGYELQIRPKSGLAIKQGLTVLNTPGTVDQGYTGEIQVIVFNTNNHSVMISKGMKVGQAVLCPVINGEYVRFEQVDQLDEKDRGDNGFGSTGI